MDAEMRSKADKLQKWMKFWSSPTKIFGKATYFYVKSMENSSNRVSYGSGVGCPSAPDVQTLTKSFSVNSFPVYNNEEFRQFSLSRAPSRKDTKQTSLQTTSLPRSYTVGLGKIGRIDEEEPCGFNEHGLKAKRLHPRSTSIAVKRN